VSALRGSRERQNAEFFIVLVPGCTRRPQKADSGEGYGFRVKRTLGEERQKQRDGDRGNGGSWKRSVRALPVADKSRSD